MSNINTFFSDLQAEIDKGFTYTPMTDEQYQISCVNDIAEWAEAVAGEWDGDDSGRLEDRAHQAKEIMEKCAELKELIEGLAEL